ncbi:MAG: DUF4367 domain-containing protein [Clostridiales bacterium]|nr:DUF4367 domain-containing protein [Clostridiales bacterium]
MKEPFDDQWEEQLRQAVCEAGDLLDAGFPVEDPHPHDFSHDFEQSMDHLLHRRRHRPAFRQVGRVACAVLLLFAGSVSFFPASAQAREIFFDWVSEQSEGAQRYFHTGDATFSGAIVHYQIDVPEGYLLKEEHRSHSSFNQLYLNDSEQFIGFSYQYETENSSSSLFVMDGDADKKSVYVHNTPADLYLSHDPTSSNTIVWTDEKTGALLEISALLNESELISLAETATPMAS